MKQFGRARNNEVFTPLTVEFVWQKGRIMPSQDPGRFRLDSCGAIIERAAHGNVGSDYGWEIDHVRPVAHSGGDELQNLQPLHWRNNRHKGDSWPTWGCLVRAA